MEPGTRKPKKHQNRRGLFTRGLSVLLNCNMKKLTLLLALLFITLGNLMAQDIIILKDKSEIEAKITEISELQIKYLKFSNQTGPVFILNISSVESILFENGVIETFDSKKEDVDNVQYDKLLTWKEGQTFVYKGVETGFANLRSIIMDMDEPLMAQYNEIERISSNRAITAWMSIGIGAPSLLALLLGAVDYNGAALIVGGIGAATSVALLIVNLSYGKKYTVAVNEFVKAFNDVDKSRKYHASVNIGLTQSGFVGLSVTF